MSNGISKEDGALEGGPSASPTARVVAPHDELVELLYDVVVNPAQYDELMDHWGKRLESIIQDEDAFDGTDDPNQPLQLDENLERHFDRAGTIMNRVGRETGKVGDDHANSVNQIEAPAIILNGKGIVVSANSAAGRVLGATKGQSCADLPVDAQFLTLMMERLQKDDTGPEEPPLALGGFDVSNGRRMLMSMSDIEDEDGNMLHMIKVIDVNWNGIVAERFAKAFGLTPAEVEIAKAYTEGTTLNEIAENKGRSVHTVRTQAKSLMAKTGIRSQVELVRVFAALSLLQVRNQGHKPRQSAAPTILLSLPDKRQLDVDFFGPANGRPVLLLHGMLTGTGLTARAQSILNRRKIRLIAPWRGSYRNTSRWPGNYDACLTAIGEDVLHLLDHLGIEKLPVLGHKSGGFFAFVLAGDHPDRVERIVALSSGIPLTRKEQISVMTRRQRIVAYTARYMPSVLPVICRAGIRQMDGHGIDRFIDALYEDAPKDKIITRDPEVRALMKIAYRDTVRQGSRGFETDAVHIVSDWSKHVERANCPVTFVHSVHDPVNPIRFVRDFVAANPGFELIETDATGHLIMHGAPELVLECL